MKSINQFIIYTGVLSTIIFTKYCSSGNVTSTKSNKNVDFIAETLKNELKEKFTTASDINNNKDYITNRMSSEKYKSQLLSLRNFIIGLSGGFSFSPLSFLSKKSSNDAKQKEYLFRLSISILVMGIYPLILLLYTICKESGKIRFYNSTYFRELFEILIGIIAGYIIGYSINNSKNKNKDFYEIEYDNNIPIILFSSVFIIFSIFCFKYFKP